ncbi:hypothetical protein ACFVUY_28700 [Kitasatospora sp. NPDC058063]|uniref:hypothetical protein n=1 Tax=unclassified Kitasatospora TaxID=2633591 RepID=UPI0036DE79DB
MNLAFRQPFLAGGNEDAAYTGFLVAYAGCSALTWAVWLRWPWRWWRWATAVGVTGRGAGRWAVGMTVGTVGRAGEPPGG